MNTLLTHANWKKVADEDIVAFFKALREEYSHITIVTNNSAIAIEFDGNVWMKNKGNRIINHDVSVAEKVFGQPQHVTELPADEAEAYMLSHA